MDDEKLAKFRALKASIPAPSPETAQKQQPTPRQSDSDRIGAMADRKDLSIRKSVAMNASVVMLKACQEAMTAEGAFKGLKGSEIWALLKSIKKTEYVENLGLLSKDEHEPDESEIPF